MNPPSNQDGLNALAKLILSQAQHTLGKFHLDYLQKGRRGGVVLFTRLQGCGCPECLALPLWPCQVFCWVKCEGEQFKRLPYAFFATN